MKKVFNKEFINTNRDFWSRYKELSTENILLVETSDHSVINHSNAVTGKMVARAKNLRIAWLKYKHTDETLMRSYSANSIFIKFPKTRPFIKFWFLLSAVFYYFSYVLVVNRLCSLKYKGIPYGDFVYDGYLATFSMATLHRFDVRLVEIFYLLLLRDYQARDILDKNNIQTILVSHYIGIDAGILSRVAMQRNIPVYWKGGGHEIFCLSLFKDLKQIYDYPLKPTLEEIDILANNFSKTVESDFEEFIDQVNNPYYGALSVAYNNIISSDISREQFLKNMNLQDKQIIFVMLHAFNDFPHSHFKEMLFADYYYWFIETYHFAKQDKSKNWIFKEHPANDFYPTRDLDMNKMMRKLPNHIRYVSSKSNVTASTVLNVADAIITCLGTAGVEMPALRGIPSVIASDTFFDGFGFTIEPKSKEEYFETLRNLSPKTLSPAQQLRARCCYLYIKKYSLLPFAAGPALTYEESKAPQKLKEIYEGRILDSYKKNADLIYSQFKEYVNEIKKNDFVSLVRLPVNKANPSPDIVCKGFY